MAANDEVVAALYEGIGDHAEEVLRTVPDPRSGESIVDHVDDLALPASPMILDAGCRDGRYAAQLAERTNGRVVGVIASEWSEAALDANAESIVASLRMVSRLRRARAAVEPRLGPWYDRNLAFESWRPWVLLGYLRGVVFVARPAPVT